MEKLRVALVAFRAEFGDKNKNLANILRWIDEAGAAGAGLVCFPEIALQGYCSVERVIQGLAESADGPCCTAIAERAKRHGLAVSLGMALRESEKVFNSQVFLGPTGFLGAQHKVHLCGMDRIYDVANEWNVIDIGGWKIGATICYDSEFPESARILAIKGADVLVMSFCNGRRNYKNEPAQPGDWKREYMPFIPSRAYDNRMFVVGVNHGGVVVDTEGYALSNPEGRPDIEEWAPKGSTHRWTGYAFAIDPLGQLIAEADQQDHNEKMLIVDLDRARLVDARCPTEVKLPSGSIRGDFVAVRRVETFGPLLERSERAPTPVEVPAHR